MTLSVHQPISACHDEAVPHPPRLTSVETEAETRAALPWVSVENDEEITDDLTGFTMILQRPQPGTRRLMRPSPVQEVFISSIRSAVMGQDVDDAFMNHRITPVVLRNDFVVKASNFMEMCQGRMEQNKRGHIKIDQAFRKNGNYFEGWVFVRWMEVGWRAAGFKAHRLGSLPLAMFPRKTDDKGLQETLDRIMQEVFPVLMECFPDCDIVPVQPSQELWGPTTTSKAGSELKDALKRAAGASSASLLAKDALKQAAEPSSTALLLREDALKQAAEPSSTSITSREDDSSTFDENSQTSAESSAPLGEDVGGVAGSEGSSRRKSNCLANLSPFRALSTLLPGGRRKRRQQLMNKRH
ncbi:expressed unknown protein [Seminavis robusta]|uniref:Uncharacterized protein n=1 Tax=Seminavis robusta TaxID=568900 RepID=A0A9N8HQ72_9STRA|nr:expressed unknown protein [Seminavis robusta]|eukprot:Sro1140_g245510.1 n/a (356) ;mRNA; r:5114-6181